MVIAKKSKNRILAGNLSLFITVFILTTLDWHFYSWYTFAAPYGTLITAVGLVVTLLCYVDIKEMLHDPAFYLMAAGDLIALINLFLINSNKGAILTVFDFLLILYLVNKLEFTQKEVLISACYLGAFFIYWTIDVKGYFKGYNTNYGGLILIAGFVFCIYVLEYFKAYLKNNGKVKASNWMILAEVVFFVWGYKIIAWYRSRCALLGLVAFLLLMIIPLKAWRSKVFYYLVTLATTVGSILFSLLYVWLGIMKDEFRIQIFYKDIISGREEIWSELWNAFIKQPITGIGSSYEIKLDWLNGLFEVHNGLLDILIVHGIAVFAITITFLIKRMFELREISGENAVSKCAMAGVFALMLPAFMENFIIVPPFSLMMLILMITAKLKAFDKKMMEE